MPSLSLGRTALKIVLLAGVAALMGCATPPPADDPEAVAEFKELNDPFEPTNRFIFDANDRVYEFVWHPLAEGYRAVFPPFMRQRVSDFLGNLKSPTVLANDLLQGNFPRAAEVLERVVLNSTFGVGGIMDVAAPLGVPRHDADFGQTLAVWGIDDGPYLVLPFFGSSNPRDAAGLAIDSLFDPLDNYLQNNGMTWVAETRFGVSVVSLFDENIDALDDVKRSSLDYYSAMRSLSRQRRTAEINEATNPTAGWVVRFVPHFSWNLQSLF